MFEFDKFHSEQRTSPTQPATAVSTVTGVRRRALLFWSEHCVECAAPECYQTCDLYQPRPDDRCRRFESGMQRNPHLRGVSGAAAEIVFQRWGKLEARGNGVLFPALLVRLVEAILYGLNPVVSLFGNLVRRFGGSAPWSSLVFELQDLAARKLQQQQLSKHKPDVFLLEIYNPSSEVSKVKLSISVSRSGLSANHGIGPLPFWVLLEIPPGYYQRQIDYGSMQSIVESGLPFNISLTPERESGTHLIFITLDFVVLDQVQSDDKAIQLTQIGRQPARPDVKCVVFDLDNTLWQGVLLEGDVQLNAEVADLFKKLDERGILISIASKNNHDDALEVLKAANLAEYLVYPMINWAPKSENIRTIAKKLNISPNALLFIDDNPFERSEVSAALPEVEVLPDTAMGTLLSHHRMSGGTTRESRNRRLMYQQQSARDQAVMEYGDDYVGFLRQCRIQVHITPYEPDVQERVVELVQRTNQLNFSGRHYARDEIAELLSDTSLIKHVIRCDDQFGDYGIVGFAIARYEESNIIVQDFMLSCRVQGKLIEKAYFDYLTKSTINSDGTLTVNFVSTDRNAPARAVLTNLGFSGGDGQPFTLGVQPGQLQVDFLTINPESRTTDAVQGA